MYHFVFILAPLSCGWNILLTIEGSKNHFGFHHGDRLCFLACQALAWPWKARILELGLTLGGTSASRCNYVHVFRTYVGHGSKHALHTLHTLHMCGTLHIYLNILGPHCTHPICLHFFPRFIGTPSGTFGRGFLALGASARGAFAECLGLLDVLLYHDPGGRQCIVLGTHQQSRQGWMVWQDEMSTRWAPPSYKWSQNPHKQGYSFIFGHL